MAVGDIGAAPADQAARVSSRGAEELHGTSRVGGRDCAFAGTNQTARIASARRCERYGAERPGARDGAAGLVRADQAAEIEVASIARDGACGMRGGDRAKIDADQAAREEVG